MLYISGVLVITGATKTGAYAMVSCVVLFNSHIGQFWSTD